MGPGDLRRLAACPRCCGAWPSATSSRGVRDRRAPRSTSASSSTCSTRTRCSAASSRSSLFVTHGAVFVVAQDRRRHPRPGAGPGDRRPASAPRSSPWPSWSGRTASGTARAPRLVRRAGRARRAAAWSPRWSPIRAGREGWAFLGTAATIAFAVAGLFVSLFPNVMPSSLDPAFSLTTDQRVEHRTTR